MARAGGRVGAVGMAGWAALDPGLLDGDWQEDGRGLEGRVEVKLARHGWWPVLFGGKWPQAVSPGAVGRTDSSGPHKSTQLVKSPWSGRPCRATRPSAGRTAAVETAVLSDCYDAPSAADEQGGSTEAREAEAECFAGGPGFFVSREKAEFSSFGRPACRDGMPRHGPRPQTTQQCPRCSEHTRWRRLRSMRGARLEGGGFEENGGASLAYLAGTNSNPGQPPCISKAIGTVPSPAVCSILDGHGTAEDSAAGYKITVPRSRNDALDVCPRQPQVCSGASSGAMLMQPVAAARSLAMWHPEGCL